MLLSKINKIDISAFLTESALQADCGLLEGAYKDEKNAIISGEYYDDEELECSLKVTSRGYSTFCSKCRSGLCRHIASLLSVYLADKDSFIDVVITHIDFSEFHSFGANVRPKKPLLKKFQKVLDGLDYAKEILPDILKACQSSTSNIIIHKIKSRTERLDEFGLSGLKFKLIDLVNGLSIEDPDKTFLRKVDLVSSLISMSKHEFSKALEEEKCYFPYSSVCSQLGYVWKSNDLEYYSSPKKTELLQLNFHSIENEEMKRLEEYSIFVDLQNTEIVVGLNIRPYNALRFIPESNSVFELLQIEGMVKYPTESNHRIRWKRETTRKLKETDVKNLFSKLVSQNENIKEKVRKYFLQATSNDPFYAFYPIQQYNSSRFKSGDDWYLFSESSETDVFLTVSEDRILNSQILFKIIEHEGSLLFTPLCLVEESGVERFGF